MIPLRSKILHSSLGGEDEDRVLRVSRNPDRPIALRRDEIFILDRDDVPDGFLGYMIFDKHYDDAVHGGLPVVVVPTDLAYLVDGDIIRVSESKLRVRVLFRSNARQNGLLLTERCNHYCLMCSQPPKDHDDSYLIDEIEEVLRLASPGATEICFTGGEPALLGDRFIRLVRLAKNLMPESSLHVLSNGRAFEEEDFAKKLGDIEHRDLMLGVPVYSDAPEIHNYVVQAENALAGTIRGIVNLNKYRVPVEIRVVLHKVTADRLVQLAEFISTNLPFVAQVAFMGLEMVGFARANKEALWVEPDCYAKDLKKAVMILNSRRIKTSVYNLQMCLMPRDLWPYMEKSISDWKNEYEPECEHCAVREACGGFFSSVVHKKPKNIKTIQVSDLA